MKRQAEEVWAHRGASAHAPENTLAAFRLAREKGAAWVELDVALMKDGTLAVVHDASLERTTGMRRYVWEVGREVLPLDAGGWFGEVFRGEPLPILGDVLGARLGLKLNIEMKAHRQEASRLAHAVAEQVRGAEEEVALVSLTLEPLRVMRRLDADVRLIVGYKAGAVSERWQEEVREVGAEAVHIAYEDASLARVEAFREAGLAVGVYTVDDPAKIAHLWAHGLDRVITNDPFAFFGSIG